MIYQAVTKNGKFQGFVWSAKEDNLKLAKKELQEHAFLYHYKRYGKMFKSVPITQWYAEHNIKEEEQTRK